MRVSSRTIRAGVGAATAACLLAVLLTSPSAANSRAAGDAKRETAPLRKNGRLDITRALARHRKGLLAHTVVVRRRVAPERGKERPVIALNTRGGRRSDPEFQVYGRAVFDVRGSGDPTAIADAELRSRGRRWTYLFDPAGIPGLEGRYGWAAITTKGSAFDVAPGRRYALHRI